MAGLTHQLREFSDAPVIMAKVTLVEKMTRDVTKFEFSSWDGEPLPEWSAGSHLDVVVTPGLLRQYSMSGNPSDSSTYQIGVLREEDGRGGSKMMHRIFNEGRRVFISKPINHFELEENADKTFLMGGGIGITPMIAFAHRLYALGRDFELHYSASTREGAGYVEDLSSVPWADQVSMHFSKEGSRANLEQLLSGYRLGWHVYTCGPDRYMQSVVEAAKRGGFPEDAQHLEYFSVPEPPDYENHEFTVKLVKSGKEFTIPKDRSLSDVLVDAGISINVKCSDGICGVCNCTVLDGEIEHRDFVLSMEQRKSQMISCQSRAAPGCNSITIDM